MSLDEPSNAVLAERIAEVKEDIRELSVYVRRNIERIDGALGRSVDKHAEIDVKVQKEHDSVVALQAVVEFDRKAHTKVHDDEHSWNRWVIGCIIAGVAAAGSLGLGALVLR